MAINLDDSLFVGQQKADSAKYDNDGKGYTDVANAMSVLPNTVRYAGLTINVNGIEYWWPASDSDTNKPPVVKISPSNTISDGLVEGGGIDVSDFADGNITVDIAKWLLTIIAVQQLYQTTSPTLFTGINYSSTGNQRYIVFAGNGSNQIIKVEGVESPAAVMPAIPADTVSIGHTLVTDSVAEPPVIDLSGYAKLNEVNTFTQRNIFKGVIHQDVTSGGFGYGWLFNGKSTVGFRYNPVTNNYQITRYDDDGNYVDEPFVISRTTGISSFKFTPTANGVNLITEAPSDGKTYGRKDEDWVEVTGGSGDTKSVNDIEPDVNGNISLDLDDIPDGTTYVRVTPTEKATWNGKESVLTFSTPLLRSANNIIIGNASETTSGIVNVGTQTFGGAKTFNNTVQATRLGAGIAPNTASKVTVGAGSTTETQVILTSRTSANNYTGTIAGALDNIDGVIKFKKTTSTQTDVITKDTNPSLASVNPLNIVISTADGSLGVGGQVRQRQITDPDIIDEIQAGTWTNNEEEIEGVYTGQTYYDETTHYFYEAYADGKMFRR